MIHWAFLILAFIAGFTSCYAMIYQVAKIAAQVTAVIEEGAKAARL